jgi:hypothetical protein
MKAQPAVRTRNYRRFYALLSQMPGGIPVEELKGIWVSDFTEGRTGSVQEMKDMEFALMIGAMEQHVADIAPNRMKLDKARKRVIAAIIAMHELNGIHPNDKVAYAKATALRNRGITDETVKGYGVNRLFNQITLNDLQTIYNWAKREQNLIKNGKANLEKLRNSLAIFN